MRVMMLMVWAVVFVSCGVEGPEIAAAPATIAARQDALTLPTAPIDVRRWLIAGQEFFPTRTSRSAYLVVMQDPSNATRFLAWGFDVRGGNCTFFGSGDRARDLNDLLAEIAREAQIGVTYDLDYTHGITVVVGKKPDPAPPIGQWRAWGEMAWNAAVKVEAAAHFTP